MAGKKRSINCANNKNKEYDKNQIEEIDKDTEFSKDQIEDTDINSDTQVKKELPVVKFGNKNFELPDYLL